MINEEDKTFLKPGDLVKLKQDLPNSPIMLVVKVERYLIKHNVQNSPLRGIRTRWFSTDNKLQEAVFSTKDLILIKE